MIFRCAILLLLFCIPLQWVHSAPTQQQLEFFEKQVRPLLVEHCYSCHSGQSKKLQAELYLDSRKGMLTGGESGAAIVVGKADKSLLMEAIRYESFEMPPRRKLAKRQVEIFKKWIDMGAPWPVETKPEPVKKKDFREEWKQRKANHWAWQPIQQVTVPEVSQHNWPENEIDHFILRKLEQKQLAPTQQADKRILIRRLSFDLIGLPPTPAEVQSFLNDNSPQAYERLVNRLLQSQHFGEKWGRHWLDLVRYAESYGHEFDRPMQHSFKYRDYIIRAFNADVPYNQFVKEHLAGDLLTKPRLHPTEKFNESIIGTGFWFFGEATHAPTDVRADEADRLDNQIDVMSKTFLGLTVSCARCHDHKFDPIATADYYALVGFLQSSRRQEVPLDAYRKQEQAARVLHSLWLEGNRSLANPKREQSPENQLFSAYLLAANNVYKQHRASHPEYYGKDVLKKPKTKPAVDSALLKQSAQAKSLSPEILNRWVILLQNPLVNQPTHPLYAWSRLASSANESDFSTAKQRLQEALLLSQKSATKWREQATVFEDFANGNAQGWFLSGQAFLNRPTQLHQWDAATRTAKNVEPNVMHSGLLSPKLHGVLRSPTFELPKGNIFIKLNSTNCEVRLIVDGYQLGIFSSLLFENTLLKTKQADTTGDFAWKRLGNPMYVGHKAYLEFIDKGDGYIAVDEIVFSNSNSVVQSPNAVNLAVLNKLTGNTHQALADAYGAYWARAFGQVSTKNENEVQRSILNLVSENRLLALPQQSISELVKSMQKVEQQINKPGYVVTMTEGTGENESIFIRGNSHNLGKEIPRRMLTAISGETQAAFSAEDGSGRLQLAARILSNENPFPARVMVNRIWQYLFGRGIVPTSDDFGKMGQLPSHPELLDWLANDFRKQGWSIKQTIRKLVTSNTYRQSSQLGNAHTRVNSIDPKNIYLSHMPVRRLTAEAIRDSILAASGGLDKTMYGPSVAVYLTPFQQGRGKPKSGPLNGNNRRSLYLAVRRNFISSMMLSFDYPIPFSTAGKRSVSNVPAQALLLMNDPFVIQQAEKWAKVLLQQSSSEEERIHILYETAFAHPPTTAELRRMKMFLTQQTKTYNAKRDDPRVWADLCHTIINMKAFIFIR